MNTSNVIVPDPTLHDNEVDLSYYTFRELFKFKIIYFLKEMDGLSLSKAYDIWKQSYQFDEKVYKVMEFMVRKCNLKLLINRNPTLRNLVSLNPSNCGEILLGLSY